MAKQTLSETAKQFLNFNDNTFNKPISFGERYTVTKATSHETKRYDKTPTVVWDAIRAVEHADNLDHKGFEKFLEDKSSNVNVQTDNDIFDKQAFEADMKALERRYNEETAWLKMNTPKSPDEMNTWNKRLQARDNLRLLLPREEDPKYHSKEIVVITKSGVECKSILDAYKRDFKAIRAEYDQRHIDDHIERHKLTMDEDAFAFLKMMHRLGLFKYDFIQHIPVEVIHEGCHRADVRNDLETAVRHFDTVSDYNKSLENLSTSRPTDPNEEDALLALMNEEIERAARALINYTSEFEALNKSASLDKPFI